MSILSGAIGTMKKKNSAVPSWSQYQVPGAFAANGKTYWVTDKSSEPNAGASGLKWKTTNTATAGTTSLTDGLANSNAMNNSTHPAAFYCRGLTLGSYTWFLPAKDELNHIYINLAAGGKLLAPTGTHADKFTGTYYWASTEHHLYSGQYAWIQHMSNGGQYGNGKGAPYYVRACRKV